MRGPPTSPRTWGGSTKPDGVGSSTTLQGSHISIPEFSAIVLRSAALSCDVQPSTASRVSLERPPEMEIRGHNTHFPRSFGLRPALPGVPGTHDLSPTSASLFPPRSGGRTIAPPACSPPRAATQASSCQAQASRPSRPVAGTASPIVLSFPCSDSSFTLYTYRATLERR